MLAGHDLVPACAPSHLARAIVRYLRDLSVLQVAPERKELVDATDEEHAELLAHAGHYAEMWARQQEAAAVRGAAEQRCAGAIVARGRRGPTTRLVRLPPWPASTP